MSKVTVYCVGGGKYPGIPSVEFAIQVERWAHSQFMELYPL